MDDLMALMDQVTINGYVLSGAEMASMAAAGNASDAVFDANRSFSHGSFHGTD